MIMKRICAFLIVLIALTTILPCTALADARTGSVTVTLCDSATKKPIPEAGWLMYRVADLRDNSYVLTKDFAKCGQNMSDLKNVDAKALADYAHKNNIYGSGKTADKNGVVRYDKLSLGVYLFVQTGSSAAYELAEPFIVNVPMTSADGKTLIYDINASPKAESEPVQPTPAPTPTPKPSDPKLPQTGQLNWPVPVLFGSGVLMLIVGFAIYMKGRKHD